LATTPGFDWPLLRWIWRYRQVDQPRVLDLIAGLAIQRARDKGLYKAG